MYFCSTSSNILSPTSEELEENSGTNRSTPTPIATPTLQGKRKADCLSSADTIFLQKMDSWASSSANLPLTFTSTQHFCMRLAGSLERLPRDVKNKLEIEFLQRIADAEEQYNT